MNRRPVHPDQPIISRALIGSADLRFDRGGAIQ